MDSRELRIVGDYLHDLAARAREARMSLDDCSQMSHLGFTGNEDVEDEFADFLNRWDRHRDNLRDGMQTVADALTGTCEAFEQTEDELIKTLNQDSR